MNHTFDVVDIKVLETEFFLRKMENSGFEMFEFNCYLSAYLAAARTITLALQQFKHIPGFDVWYKPHQENLRANELAKFFLNIRNSHLHGGPYPVNGGSLRNGQATYHFNFLEAGSKFPVSDVVSACRENFILLLEVVYDCYKELGVHIDPQQYYTKENFSSLNRSIDDAEIEVMGWVCVSLVDDGFDEDGRWHELRSHVGECSINNLFFSYLQKVTPQPKVPDHFNDFDLTPEEKGWVHMPVGFKSIEEYIESIKRE